MSCIEIVTTAILALNPSWAEGRVEKYSVPICLEAKHQDIDPLIIVSVIHHETMWKPNSVNKNKNGSIDYGLMQVNCVSLDKIYMKWRRYWCHPKRRKRLMTIKGNITAGTKELSIWKSICLKKHKYYSFIYNIKYINNSKEVDCNDCYLSFSSLYLYRFTERTRLLKNVLSEHWWIQHYNWKSKNYFKSILYIYIALKNKMKNIYKVLRRRAYTRFNSKKCLLKEDLCLKEYKKWRQR